MSLSNYWPLQAEVDSCIRTEAETIDEAVLLAVHHPTRIVHRSASRSVEEEKSEQDLLDALLRDSADGSAVIVSLTGPSGVGKSHMVRWLHAQLQRHERHAQMVMILVPKTASLRRVVELILEPLEGTEYDKLRSSLNTAIASISTEDAAAHLATELVLQLKRKTSEWIAALDSSEDRTLRSKAHHAQKLQILLSDPVFREGMLNTALERIVSRAVSGDPSGTKQLPQFEEDDFIWTSEQSFADATRPAQKYFESLADHDGQLRSIAVAVLNTVIDPAMRVVFRFSQALGGRTIEEIVDMIRVQLLRENKELVLLIEDFAALSGIQEPLLSMIIAESEHGGFRVRAPIRTALAVTDGFMPQRDTILTRARGEWIIASEYGSEEALLDRFVEMAGRYLNAARWGRAALRAQFAARVDQSTSGLYGWIRPYADDNLDAVDADRLEAFGRTRSGYPLFPLNEAALHSLCRRELPSGGKLVFNPRAFINRVLRETLDQRHLYEQGAFPPATFKPDILPPGTETELDGMSRPASVKARLKTMLVHWCGNPSSLRGAAPIEPAVFEAFGLPFPFSADARPQSATKPGPGNGGTGGPLEPDPPPPPRPSVSAFEKEIGSWAASSKLLQTTARRIRSLVADGVVQRLDLDAAMVRKIADWIWLPYVDIGNPQTPPAFRLAEPSGEITGWLRQALIGLDKREQFKGWDFPAAEDYYGYAQRLLDAIASQVERHLRQVGQTRLGAAMQLAYRQNLMLGVGVTRAMPTALFKMFEPAEASFNEADFLSFGENDRAVTLGRAIMRARRMRTKLQEVVLAESACFQGTGKAALAIDYARVAAAWSVDLDDSALRAEPEQEFREHIAELGNGHLGFSRIATHFSTVLSNHGKYLLEALGEGLDKDIWIDNFRKTLTQAQAQGYMPHDFDHKRDMSQLEQLGRAALTELVRSVQQALMVPVEADVEERMRAYARVDVGLLIRAVKDLRRLQVLLVGISRNMGGAEQQARRDEVGEVRAAFIDELQAATTLLSGDFA
ncbi:protein DpdH [Telluria sp. Tellsp104]